MIRRSSRARELVQAVRLRVVMVVLALLPALPAAAEVTRIEIASRTTLAEGASFGLAGRYEKLIGTVHYAFDPTHATNRRIVDLDKAPRDAEGRVRATADFYALRPVDPHRGNGTLLVEVPNRGSKASVRYFDRGAARTFDPTTRQDLGDAFLMRQGFTVVWIGWQFDVPDRPELLRLHVPVARTEPPIEGLVRSDHVFSEDAKILPLAHREHRAYPVADPDDPRNVLTVRDGRLAERTTIPREKWRFARVDVAGEVVADPRFVYLEEGFEKGKIYEVVYVARDPAVVGLGFAALRDAISYLKHDPRSPAPGKRAIAVGISQTGRFLRTFLYQGMNRDRDGRPAFDGMLIHTAGAGRGSFNHRFAQPSRDAHPYSAFFYPTDLFPFTGTVQEDPLSGRREGLLEPAAERGPLPEIFFTNSGYEYWGRAAALIHTAVDGTADVPLLPNVRAYHFASTQHFVGGFPPRRAETAYPSNPADFLFFLRALLVAMNEWLADGVEPPPSVIPRIESRTLVPPEGLRFPAIPGVRVPTKAHEAYRVDYGPRFRDAGIVELEPPKLGPAFPVRVPQVDADGNEIGGLRLPEIAVPLATYAPWNWRGPKIGAPDELADFRGSFFPFSRTAEERETRGDPRPSIAERYPSREAYLGRYVAAAVDLVGKRYLLAEDLPELVARANALWATVHGDEEANR